MSFGYHNDCVALPRIFTRVLLRHWYNIYLKFLTLLGHYNDAIVKYLIILRQHNDAFVIFIRMIEYNIIPRDIQSLFPEQFRHYIDII
jgi:hypothetical protein